MSKKKSVLKRIRTNNRNRIANKTYKSVVRTLMKRFMLQVESLNVNDPDSMSSIQNLMSLTYSKIDRAVKKNVFHANNGARKKSALSRKLASQLSN
uniref:ribosomal protein S20 n=1 Tax=Erythrolobus coxiae TaxID=362235 RepID=UPI001FCDFAB5|nr:ribosomal protein S20 [Erythrolobus coxiae]UNJ17774.1 ribosomal protein S20 [Erythrolobus coxiae]